MSSFESRRRHLDATSGREVVYCHCCSHEWYRDERDSLQCPRCRQDATEIIDPANDIRNEILPPPSPGTFGFGQRRRDNSDSDPEEDDIENHMRQNPFFSRQQNREADLTLRRFADLFRNEAGLPHSPSSAPNPHFPPSPRGDRDPFGGFLFPTTPMREGGTSSYSRTYRSENGMTSVSFYSTTIPAGGRGPEGAPQFNALFNHLMGNPPGGEVPPRGAGVPGERPIQGFRLHDFLAALIPGAAGLNGDVVRTQEELDRIITALMEANPQSNAAPPASQTAIERLEKKKLDETMLGAEGKAECTICIDELHKGDEVTVLPCTHWFHGECVTMWLKEHNTCPICRASIEGDQSQGSNNNSGNPSSSQTPSPGQSASSAQAPSFASLFGQPRDNQPGNSPQRPTPSSRQNAERLNAIRATAGMRPEPYSTPPRRNSLSPVSSRNYGEGTSRSRVRSPSISQDQDSGVSPYDRNRSDFSARYSIYPPRQDNRESRDGDNRSNQGSGHGATSWLRDHFGRAFGGSDRRRGP